MKKITTIIVSLLLAGSGYAQMEIPYSQIINNPGWIDPAYQGINKGTSLDLAYKRQWQGFDGAPNTLGFNLHHSFDKIKLGAGVKGFFEESGYRRNNRIDVNLNTAIDLSRNSQLLFGLTMGVDMRRYKSFGDAVTDVDMSQYQNLYNRESFVGGFGVDYKWKDLTVGASAFMTFVKGDNQTNLGNVYAHANYDIRLSEDWNLRPMALYSYSNYMDSYGEVGLMGGYAKIVEIGASYRFDRNVSILADIRLARFLSIGYSYDINTGQLADLSRGSHEFGLRFSFGGPSERD